MNDLFEKDIDFKFYKLVLLYSVPKIILNPSKIVNYYYDEEFHFSEGHC